MKLVSNQLIQYVTGRLIRKMGTDMQACIWVCVAVAGRTLVRICYSSEANRQRIICLLLYHFSFAQVSSFIF